MKSGQLASFKDGQRGILREVYPPNSRGDVYAVFISDTGAAFTANASELTIIPPAALDADEATDDG